MNFRIQTKLLVYILPTSLLIYIIAFGYLSYNDHELAINESKELANSYAEKYANYIMMQLNGDMNITRTLVQSFHNYEWVFENNIQEQYFSTIENVLANNPQFHNAAINFELGAIDKTYKKSYGRVRYIFYKEKGLINRRIDTLETEGDQVGGAYFDMKLNPREDLSEPYWFSISGDKEDEELISSISIPVMEDKDYIGLMQFDVNLERFQELIMQIKIFPGSFGFIVSNKGKFVAIPDKKMINVGIDSISPADNAQFKIIENVQKGKQFSFMRKDSSGIEDYISFYPIKLGKSPSPWAVGISIPYKTMIKRADQNLFFSILVAISGFILLTFVIWVISRSISKPLVHTTKVIRELAKGKISLQQKMEIDSNDEIGDIRRSVNMLIDGLDNNLRFALEIGKGNLDFEFKPLSDEDILGKALLNMRESLQQAKIEEEKRKAEDEKLNWATKGAATFAELMTQHSDNLEEFSYVIISNLVRYLNATQGGLFIINDEDKNNLTIDLTAAYAYDRRKYLEKKIRYGVGLVGRCVNEAETIYMTDFPEDYLNITSGLGSAQPRSLLLVPIIFNQQVFGVIEIASVHELEDYQIKFVERIGESIASTISNVKINQQTAKLLEESKIKSEELVAQEEEMRQNMEEMKATQEELERKAFEFKSVIDALDTIILTAEFDMQGRLININKNFLRLLGKSKKEMLGKFQGSFASVHEENIQFRNFWKDLRNGKTKKTIQHIEVDGKEFWLSEAYTPILDKSGMPYKVLNISVDISDSVKKDK